MTEATEKPATGGRVLVVDDERANRALLRDLLIAEGHAVIEAMNGDQAWRLIQAQPIDVVLLDVVMPGTDGIEICRRIKQTPATAAIPVLLVTSLRKREDRLHGIAAGADDFLNKPVDAEEVLLRVRNAIRSKRLYDELQQQYQQLRQMTELREKLTRMLVDDTAALATLLGRPLTPPAGQDATAGETET
ncbi:MAG: response regulator [Lentisphaerae bacterium]|nr:response regulator [Lentisphaerota bacterium]